MTVAGRRGCPKSESAVHMYPCIGAAGTRADFGGRIECAGIDIAGLNADQRHGIERRKRVRTNSSLIVHRNTAQALAAESCQAKRFENGHMNLFTDDYVDRRRLK